MRDGGVLLKESYGGGLSYCESCLLHGVSYSTARADVRNAMQGSDRYRRFKNIRPARACLRLMRPATKRSESLAGANQGGSLRIIRKR